MGDNLIELLERNRAAEPRDRVGWRCPDQTRLAAYVDGNLDEKSRNLLHTHLANCSSCIDQVGFLTRSQDWSEFSQVPQTVKVRAKNLVESKSKARFALDWRWAAAALAACLVAAFLLVLATRTREVSRPGNPNLIAAQPQSSAAPAEPSASRNPDVVAAGNLPPALRPSPLKSRDQQSSPVVRKDKADNSVPELLSPKEGAVLRREDIQLRWQTMPDVIFYEVSVKDASGSVLRTTRTESAGLKLTSDLPLTAGTKYFVSVRAYLHEGGIVRSKVISFTVAR